MAIVPNHATNKLQEYPNKGKGMEELVFICPTEVAREVEGNRRIPLHLGPPLSLLNLGGNY